MVTRTRLEVHKIAVIGAGPVGLAAAKYLLAQNAFNEVLVFEQSAEVGGVWNYSKRPTDTLYVPQVSPFCPPDPPLVPQEDGGAPFFPSPMYDLLHANIPKTLMCFSDMAFPTDCVVFPPRSVVQEYLVEYSQGVRHLVRFSTQVRDVRLRRDGAGRDQWDVVSIDLLVGGDSTTTSTFDAVVVASGHYATTYVPDIPGIREFHASHPGVISHAKSYRSPESFRDKKVVVVGNAASGIDIAAQVNKTCKHLLLSVREPTPPENLAHIGAEEVPAIAEFLVQERGVRLVDGRVERGIDAVIFCTGYLFSFPFLEKTLEAALLTDGRRVHGLYQDFIHIHHPTLAFPGLPIKVVPFPFAEAQAAILARLWSNCLPLPSVREMQQWEDRAAEERGPAFHAYPKKGDVEYLRTMHAWAMKADAGKEPPVWTEDQVWQRETCAQAKLKFEQTGRTAKTLEELGFRFRPYGNGAAQAPELL